VVVVKEEMREESLKILGAIDASRLLSPALTRLRDALQSPILGPSG
jgi:hypothetical protein